MKTVRYVISGAGGFIGSHLCDRLIDAGHQVSAIDNLITGHRENIAHLLGRDRFEFLEADVCQKLDVPGPVDRVFHLASLASPVHYLAHPIETLESGSTGTRNMLELARAEERPLLTDLDIGVLRRSAGTSAARNILGQREPGRIAVLL